MSEEEITILSCGCTSQGNPVFWNEFNKVVQCHKCGSIYEMKSSKPLQAEAVGGGTASEIELPEFIYRSLGESIRIRYNRDRKVTDEWNKHLKSISDYAASQVAIQTEAKDKEIESYQKAIGALSDKIEKLEQINSKYFIR